MRSLRWLGRIPASGAEPQPVGGRVLQPGGAATSPASRPEDVAARLVRAMWDEPLKLHGVEAKQ